MDHFRVGVTIGTGSFSRVRIATHKGTGTVWAIKSLKKVDVIRLRQVDHILSEKTIMASLDHPFIVRFGGCFQDDRFLHLVLEYAPGGEFFTHLQKAGRLENEAARFYAAQTLLIIEHMHGNSIIYRDLKPENLMLDAQGYFKLTDFGFAKKVAFKTYTLCGTPEYIAPEVLLNKGHGKSVDWWGLGVLLYEMLSGHTPFVADDISDVYYQIVKGHVRFPKYFERAAKSLLKRLLTPDITRRLGCARRGADEVKDHKFFAGFDWEALYSRSIVAPILPRVEGDDDTQNFDPYPESDEEAPRPEFEDSQDPFVDF